MKKINTKMICRYFNKIRQKNTFLFNVSVLFYNIIGFATYFIGIQFYITALPIHTAGI